MQEYIAHWLIPNPLVKSSPKNMASKSSNNEYSCMACMEAVSLELALLCPHE